MNQHRSLTFFAPHLVIPHGVTDLSFYAMAFGAIELRQFLNEDGSYHVSEMTIDGCLFHLHEAVERSGELDPQTVKGVTCTIGLFVADVDAVMSNALSAGAVLRSPARDYDYGYRQGQVLDPFGHPWLIQQKIA